MMRRPSFNEEARSEFDEAVDYYHQARHGLGAEFLDAVEEAVIQIAEYPEMCPISIENVREKVMHRFPFSIFYSAHSKEIRILAVAHHRRRPFYWADRK